MLPRPGEPSTIASTVNYAFSCTRRHTERKTEMCLQLNAARRPMCGQSKSRRCRVVSVGGMGRTIAAPTNNKKCVRCQDVGPDGCSMDSLRPVDKDSSSGGDLSLAHFNQPSMSPVIRSFVCAEIAKYVFHFWRAMPAVPLPLSSTSNAHRTQYNKEGRHYATCDVSDILFRLFTAQ